MRPRDTSVLPPILRRRRRRHVVSVIFAGHAHGATMAATRVAGAAVEAITGVVTRAVNTGCRHRRRCQRGMARFPSVGVAAVTPAITHFHVIIDVVVIMIFQPHDVLDDVMVMMVVFVICRAMACFALSAITDDGATAAAATAFPVIVVVNDAVVVVVVVVVVARANESP